MSNELPPVPPAEPDEEAHSLDDFVRQGWVRHVNRDLTGAEQSFRTAMQKDPLSYEATYGLGMVLKLQNRKEDAIQAFQKTITLIQDNPNTDDYARKTMLRHLSEAHISMMQKNYGEALP